MDNDHYCEHKGDNVNHPKHYEQSCSLECIDVMTVAFGQTAVFDFCLCNAFKYLWRYKHKNGKEDVDKARWYLKHITDSKFDMSDKQAEHYFDMVSLLMRIKEEESKV